MNEKDLSQDAKSFVNNVFIDELREKYRNEGKGHTESIDFAAGGKLNMERFTEVWIPDGLNEDYQSKLHDAKLVVKNLNEDQVTE